jgi:hypothetical protein
MWSRQIDHWLDERTYFKNQFALAKVGLDAAEITISKQTDLANALEQSRDNWKQIANRRKTGNILLVTGVSIAVAGLILVAILK